jgi:hypothetical protein
MPCEYEGQDENKEAGADEDLDETEDGDEPLEKRLSPKPVGKHAADCDRLEKSER